MLPDPETRERSRGERMTKNRFATTCDWRTGTGTLRFSVLYRYVPVLTRTHNLKPTPRVQSIVPGTSKASCT